MADMIATKSFVYANRRLLPDQDFTTKTERDAKLLVALKKARRARRASAGAIGHSMGDVSSAVTTGAPAKGTVSDLAALRAAYQKRVGKKPYHGWDEATLKAKIAEASQP